MKKRYYSVNEYAKKIGRSRNNVYMDIRLGKIKAKKMVVVERLMIEAEE